MGGMVKAEGIAAFPPAVAAVSSLGPPRPNNFFHSEDHVHVPPFAIRVFHTLIIVPCGTANVALPPSEQARLTRVCRVRRLDAINSNPNKTLEVDYVLVRAVGDTEQAVRGAEAPRKNIALTVRAVSIRS